MAEVQFEILGPLRVRSGGVPLELGGPTQRALLAVLLAEPNVTVADDRLVDEVWGADPPPSAHHALQVYVSRLRAVLADGSGGARLVRQGTGYALRVGPDELDADRFVAACDQGRALCEREPRAAEQILREALGLWRGAPFADLVEQPPVVRERAAFLERQHLAAVDSWADVGLRLGRHHEVVGELAEMAAQHPYEEALHGQLMLGLYRCGRQAEALQVGSALETRLREELGIDASPQIRERYRDILLQSPALAFEAPLPPCNLPARLTSFVGRVDELEAVSRLLDGNRLVTLTGTGGIGKTRLAIEVADRLRPRFAGGVWWIDLAPVRDPDMVPGEVAAVLGVVSTAGVELVDALVLALHHRSTLLLIDNCEHVRGAVAALAAHLVANTTRLCVLATSRTPLQVEGERRWTVPPLRVPTEDVDHATEVSASEAVQLFVERGRQVEPSFGLDEGNARAAAEVCRRLDGLPLAIEMAAARLPVLTPQEIVELLDERFALLEMEATGTITRHRTLQAAVDASYALLPPDQRAAFARLSVFVGPFDRPAAAAVALARPSPSSTVVDLLSALVDASMLTAVRAGDSTRYRMLETLREFGSDRLRADGGEDRARRAHARYYLDLAARARLSADTPDFSTWVDHLGDDYAEIREALAWSLAHDALSSTLRALPALREFWYRRGDAREAGRWSDRVLARDLRTVPADLRAEVHNAACFAATLATDSTSLSHAEESLRLSRAAGDPHAIIVALWSRGQAAIVAGDLATAHGAGVEALELCDRYGERWLRARALSVLGWASLFGGSAGEARLRFGEALPLYRELGDSGSAVIMALLPLSVAARRQGDLDAAERYACEAVELASGTGWEAMALGVYGDALAAAGDLDAARMVAQRGLRIALRAGLEYGFRMTLLCLAGIAAEREGLDDASTLLGAGRKNMPDHAYADFKPLERRCRDVLGDARFDELAARGRALTHEQILDLEPTAADAARLPS